MARKRGETAQSTALRMLRTLQLIPRHSEGACPKIGTRTLLARLKEEGYSISLRTLQRDLNALQEAFPGLSNDGNRDAMGWYWRADAAQIDIPCMDQAQALALVLAERFLAPVMPGILDIVEGYRATARRVLGDQAGGLLDRVRVVPRTMPLRPADTPPRVLETVLRALAEERRLRVRYRSRSGGVPGEYELSPLGLVCQHEVTHLLATAWEYDDVRQYALHRMEANHMQLLDTGLHVPEGFELDDYLARGGVHFPKGQGALRLRLRMREATAAHLRETPLADDQHLVPLEAEAPGWVRVEASVADTLQLRWWLLGFGDAVVVEAPESLREEIEGTLRRAAAEYGAAQISV